MTIKMDLETIETIVFCEVTMKKVKLHDYTLYSKKVYLIEGENRMVGTMVGREEGRRNEK